MPRKKKESPQAEPEQHLGLLHKIVWDMTTIPLYLKDEAVSEGMVLLTQAAQSFDPSRGVPVSKWLAFKVHNGLINWRITEARKHWHETLEDEHTYNFHDAHAARMELESLVLLAHEHLSDEEYIAVIGPAFGLQMKELSHTLKANPLQVMKLQERGRRVIQEMRLL